MSYKILTINVHRRRHVVICENLKCFWQCGVSEIGNVPSLESSCWVFLIMLNWLVKGVISSVSKFTVRLRLHHGGKKELIYGPV